MEEGEFVIDHINPFNILFAQKICVGDKIDDQDKYMFLLYSFPNSWDHHVMAIGSTRMTFKIEDVVGSMLSKEMQRESSKMDKEALVAHGRTMEKGKEKDKKGKSNSLRRSKSPSKKSKAKCWNFCKSNHF